MKWTIKKALELQQEKKISPVELIQELRKNYNPDLNIFITDLFDQAIEEAKNKTYVIPFALKDNTFLKGVKCTAGSKMLKDFIAPFNATIVDRLLKIDCIPIGKTNLDEFACGSSGKTSAFGITKSPLKNKKNEYLSPGGSSSGSAAALASQCCLFATGTDTGGSIRQPAAWCGLFGLKPTYGVFSRYGLVDFGSALDCPGYFTNSLEDMEFLFNHTIGFDENDYTSQDYIPQNGKKVLGIIENFVNKDPQFQAKLDSILQNTNYEIRYFNIPELESAVSLYYILAPSELTSNLSRYDGRFFGPKSSYSLSKVFKNVRSDNFGAEVQRRILIGNYVLTSAKQDEFFMHARKAIQYIWEKIEVLFRDVDVLLCPTASEGMTVTETLNADPVKMYNCDIFTCFVNMIGLPALSVPIGFYDSHLPMSLQIISKPFGENLIFDFAKTEIGIKE